MAGLADWHKETSRRKASLPLSTIESILMAWITSIEIAPIRRRLVFVQQPAKAAHAIERGGEILRLFNGGVNS